MNRLIIWCKYYKLFFYILEGYLKYVKQNECVLKTNQSTEFDFILQNSIASCHKNNEEESTLVVIDLV